jgi:aminoglycoside phosphotransferase (APT) family kinase protein
VVSEVRLRWAQVPEAIRGAVEGALQSAVVGEAVQSGGFSPGLASKLVLADGRRVFVKAINPDRDPHAPGLYRREIAVMGAMPSAVPAPGLVWSYDDGDWVLLVTEWVDGRMPREPWDRGELERVLAALGEMAALLTPSPLAVPSVVEDLAANFGAWRAMSEGGPLDARAGVWAAEHAEVLVGLEDSWAAAAKGDTLVHADLRADNMLLTESGVAVIDWPYAVAGAPWLDALFFLPSVAASTPGVDLEEVWASYGPARGADADAVNAVLAALAGDWVRMSLLPAPPNLPTLREHQAAKGAAALAWLRSRIS